MMKKKLLTVLICSLALSFCISGSVLGAEDPPQGEGYHDGETEEGDKDSTDSPNPDPEDESKKDTENDQENTDTDNKTDSGNNQGGQEPDKKPDPEPEPKPDPSPEGISIDPQTQKMIVDLSIMETVQISNNTINVSYLDNRDYMGNATIPAAGCIFRKAPSANTYIFLANPSVPILLEGSGTETPYTYRIEGKLENVSSLQVNGILWLTQQNAFSGNITASRVSSKNKLTIKSGNISLSTLDAAEIAVEGGNLTVQDLIQTTGPLSISGGTVLCKGAIQ